MTKRWLRPIHRSILAATVIWGALALGARSARASGECWGGCLWGCPVDKHFYCRVMAGSQCGFSAYCTQGGACGALMTELHCTDLLE